MGRVVQYARQILAIRGRQGYTLRPSKTNPRVKRWMREAEQDAPRGRAAIAWLDAVGNTELRKLLEPSIGQDWDTIYQAAQSSARGFLPRNYTWQDAEPVRGVRDSAIFGEIETRPGLPPLDDVLNAFGVRHPDQLIFRNFGTYAPDLLSRVGLRKASIWFYNDAGNSGEIRPAYSMDLPVRELPPSDNYAVRRVLRSDEEVHNDLFWFPEQDRSKGAATAGYAAQLANYRQAGLKKVSLLANLTHGGYVWATLGFDFADVDDREFVLGEAEGVVDSLAHQYGQGAVATAIQAVRRMKDRLGSKDPPRAFEIASLRMDKPPKDELARNRDWNIGLQALAGRQYNAYMDLQDNRGFVEFTDTALRRLAKLENGTN